MVGWAGRDVLVEDVGHGLEGAATGTDRPWTWGFFAGTSSSGFQSCLPPGFLWVGGPRSKFWVSVGRARLLVVGEDDDFSFFGSIEGGGERCFLCPRTSESSRSGLDPGVLTVSKSPGVSSRPEPRFREDGRTAGRLSDLWTNHVSFKAHGRGGEDASVAIG